MTTPDQKNSSKKFITLGLSTSALFDMRESNRIYEECRKEGNLGAYEQHMEMSAKEPLKPGHAFELIHTLGVMNKTLGTALIDIVLISRNSLSTGRRAIASCEHYGLPFTGATFTGGSDPLGYLKSYGVDWFITDKEADAIAAHNLGVASCTIDSPVFNKNDLKNDFNESCKKGIHLVWDLDRVLFGPESDEVFTNLGPTSYDEHEEKHSKELLSDGPFTDIARVLGILTKEFNHNGHFISSALTMRGGSSAHRAIHTLSEKGIIFNGESHFSGGMLLKDGQKVAKQVRKPDILAAMKDKYPDHALLFLDDSRPTIEKTREIVPSGLVPRGSGLALGETPSPK